MMLLRNFKRFFNKALRQPLYAAGVFRKRLAAHMHYRFSGLRCGDPEAITLFLTHKCNLHCKMCGQWGEGGVTKKAGAQYIQSELPFEAIKKLVDEVAAFRSNMTLFGGEPLLHTHVLDIIKYIKSKRMHCLVITNGFLLKKMAADLVASSLDELNVSLDGKAELHDRIRGMPGLFNRIMDGLKELASLKASGNKRRPLVNLQCTVTRYNYAHLEEMIDVAHEAGADSLTFHNLIFTNKSVLEKQKKYDELMGCSSAEWEGFSFEPGIDPGALHEKMRNILSGRYPFGVDFYPNFSRRDLMNYYTDPCFTPSEYPARCLSPWIVAYIFPDGEVRPCLDCTYSFGNIRNDKFSDIWNNGKAVRFRQLLKENKIFPVCARCTELYRY